MMRLVMVFLSVVGRRAFYNIPSRRRLSSALSAVRRRGPDPEARRKELAAARAAEVQILGREPPERKAIPARAKREVLVRQRYTCVACGCMLPVDHEFDHVVPVALNGSNDVTNIQALCRRCHTQKTRDQRHTILKARPPAEPPKRTVTPPPPPPPPPPPRVVVRHNEGQRRAVETEAKAVRVVAGPGTGKTRVLIDRVADLISRRNAAPHSILAVTFSNKAANELRERLDDGPLQADSLSVGTFHRVCLQILRRDVDGLADSPIERGFAVYDQAAMIALTKYCIKDVLNLDKETYPPVRVQSMISTAKNLRATSLADVILEQRRRVAKKKKELIDDSYDDSYDDDDEYVATLDLIYREYQLELARRNAVDFDDMLLLTARLLSENHGVRDKYRRRWRHVLVDEFQDTNGLQFDVLKGLAGGESQSVFVVGDADQAIYGWRGADYANLEKFDEAFDNPEKVVLTLNYRSTQPILDAASAVVAATSTRRRDDVTLVAAAALGEEEEDYDDDNSGTPPPGKKKKKARKGVSLVAVEDQDGEARYVADVVKRVVDAEDFSIGILYRTNAQSGHLERELLSRGVAFTLAQGRAFFERKEVMDAMALLRLVNAPSDDLALERVANVPPRGFGAKSMLALREAARADDVPLVDAVDGAQLRPKARDALKSFLGVVVESGDRFRAHRNDTTQNKDDDLVVTTSPSQRFRDNHRRTLLLEDEEEEGKKVKKNDDDDDEDATGPPPGTVASLLLELLLMTGYEEYVRRELENGVDRARNLRELTNLATPFGSDLEGFLDDCALLSDADGRAEDRQKRASVHLSTVHAAKGLEFDVCFVVGCEDNLFPHYYALQKKNDDDEDAVDDSPDIDEERRLLYVAMTRAKRHLYLVHARRRMNWGVYRDADPSRFLKDLKNAGIDLDYYDAQGGGTNNAEKMKRPSSSHSYRSSYRRPPGGASAARTAGYN